MKKSVSKSEELATSFFTWVTAAIFIYFLVLTIAFSFLLDQKTGHSFNLSSILFDIGLTVVITLALTWVKDVMITNPYLGLGITIIGLMASIYSLFLQYQGPYTIGFATAASIVVVAYTIVYFFKYRTQQN